MQEESFHLLFDAYISKYKDDLPFWRMLARKCGGPVLELGCGTGRVLLDLALDGHTVEGIDSDPDMLEVARSKLFPAHLDLVNLHLGDLRTMSMRSTYPLIIIPCNTLAYFGAQECKQILKRARDHLTQGGYLVMDTPNPESDSITNAFDVLDQDSELISTFVSPRTEHAVQVSARQSTGHNSDEIIIMWYFDELRPDGTVQRFEHEIHYHLRSSHTMKQILSQVGFIGINFFGDYDSSDLKKDSQRLLISCNKG
jgi:SAM-dependent methyltransferase